MEYQIRREVNYGPFYLVSVSKNKQVVLDNEKENDMGEYRVPGKTIAEQLKNLKPHIKPIPEELIRFVEKINVHHERTKDSKPQVPWDILPSSKFIPFNYQKSTIQSMYQSKRKINALEMGLGKTFCLITLIRILKAELKLQTKLDFGKTKFLHCLLVLPPRLMKQWKKEINKMAPELLIRCVTSSTTADFTPNVDILLLSDGLLDNQDLINQILLGKSFDLIGVDEAHSMQNYQSERSKAMYRLACHTNRLYLLSGTPSMSHKMIYGLLRLIHPIFQNYFHDKPYPIPASDKRFWFAPRYNPPFKKNIGRGKSIWDFSRDIRKKELHDILSEFIIRKTAEEYLPDLPPLTEEIVYLKAQNNKHKAEFQESVAKMKQYREKNANYANKLLMDLVRKTAELKIPLVFQHLKEVLSKTTHKIAVFLHHHVLSKGLADAFKENNIEFLLIDSSVPIEKREDLIDGFKESKTGRVLVVSYGCCAVGLNNLTFIYNCFVAERVYDAVLVKQSKSRFRRIGQTNPVRLVFLDLEDSTDTMLEQNYNRKDKSNEFLLHYDHEKELEEVKEVLEKEGKLVTPDQTKIQEEYVMEQTSKKRKEKQCIPFMLLKKGKPNVQIMAIAAG
jgi:SNF2 family DNA or RNA helicase